MSGDGGAVVPPISRMGAVVILERVLARTPALALLLPMIRAYDVGCLIHLDVVARNDMAPRGLALRLDSAFSGEDSTCPHVRVRYPGGAEIHSDEAGHCAPPNLSWFPGGVRSDGAYTLYEMPLWLFPLPPSEDFTLTVEWPWARIGPKAVTLDGAAIAGAAARSASCWL